MNYRGDIRLGDTIDIKFTTRRFTTGAPFTLAGTPAVAAYVGNGTTEITAGITLTVDFDSRTGLHNVRVVATSGNGYAAGTNVDLVITAGTVDSVSVVGEVIGSFSIENRSAVMPTTAGRTLDVSAGGEAGVDWANIGSPTTTVNLSGTTVKTATDVETDTADIQTRLPAALVSGRMDSSVGAMAANVLTASAINADAITAAKIADGAIDAATFAAGAINAAAIAADAITDAKVAADVTIASVTGAVGSVTGNVGGNVTGSVGSVASSVTVGTNNDKTGYGLSSGAIQAIWDALTSALTTAGSIGKLLVDNINATIGSRLASASYTAPLDAAGTRAAVGLAAANLDTQIATLATATDLATVDTVVDAIKAKTDSLNFTVAGQVDSNVQYVNDTQVTGDGHTGTEWGPA